MLQRSVIGPWALLSLHGEFDVVNSDDIRAEVSDLVERGVTDLTVDLSAATFISAATLNALVAANSCISSVGGRLVTVGAHGLTARVLAATGLTECLGVFSAPVAAPEATAEGPAPKADQIAVADQAGVAKADPDEDLVGHCLQLSLALLREPTMTGDFERIVHGATAVIPGCAAASISLIVNGQPRSTAATSRCAVEVDLAQYLLDEGPSLDAARHAKCVRVDVLVAEERFVDFAPLAVEVGIRSTLSAPVVVGRRAVGSLNIYATTAGVFDRRAELLAEVLAGQAAAAIVKHDVDGSIELAAEVRQGHRDEVVDGLAGSAVLGVLRACSVDLARHLRAQGDDADPEPLTAAVRRFFAKTVPLANGPRRVDVTR